MIKVSASSSVIKCINPAIKTIVWQKCIKIQDPVLSHKTHFRSKKTIGWKWKDERKLGTDQMSLGLGEPNDSAGRPLSGREVLSYSWQSSWSTWIWFGLGWPRGVSTGRWGTGLGRLLILSWWLLAPLADSTNHMQLVIRRGRSQKQEGKFLIQPTAGWMFQGTAWGISTNGRTWAQSEAASPPRRWSELSQPGYRKPRDHLLDWQPELPGDSLPEVTNKGSRASQL